MIGIDMTAMADRNAGKRNCIVYVRPALSAEVLTKADGIDSKSNYSVWKCKNAKVLANGLCFTFANVQF